MRPPKLTDKDKAEVQELIGYGLTVEQIAQIKGCSAKTIHNTCQEEIDRGRPIAAAQVLRTAFKMATSGKCPAMTMFWLKCRMGWSEVNRGDDKPAGFNVVMDSATLQPESLDDEQ